MRIIFAGTPHFTVPIIETIRQTTAQAGGGQNQLVAVYTQPDRKAGRGRKFTVSPVKQWVQAHDYPLEQPWQWDASAVEQLQHYQPDLMIVVAYGVLLPQSVLQVPTLGCVNIHTSLLPRWRGAAPVARAIQYGDTVTGVSLMQMQETLDTGAIICQRKQLITATDTTDTLCRKLIALASTMLQEFLSAAEQKIAVAKPQCDEGVCYAEKISKQEAWIDWHQSAQQIVQQVHAFNSSPVAQTQYGNNCLRIWDAIVATEVGYEGLTGQIVAIDKSGILVCCGKGAVRLTEVQPAGKKAMPAFAFAQGHDLIGHKFVFPKAH